MSYMTSTEPISDRAAEAAAKLAGVYNLRTKEVIDCVQSLADEEDR